MEVDEILKIGGGKGEESRVSLKPGRAVAGRMWGWYWDGGVDP